MDNTQIIDLGIYQQLIVTLTTVLDNQVKLVPADRSANGVSDANIVNLNSTLENTLAAIDLILVPIET